ncbi:MAG: hypothetical protein AB7F43_07885 [Bacteriovoracia bacterium]
MKKAFVWLGILFLSVHCLAANVEPQNNWRCKDTLLASTAGLIMTTVFGVSGGWAASNQDNPLAMQHVLINKIREDEEDIEDYIGWDYYEIDRTKRTPKNDPRPSPKYGKNIRKKFRKNK